MKSSWRKLSVLAAGVLALACFVGFTATASAAPDPVAGWLTSICPGTNVLVDDAYEEEGSIQTGWEDCGYEDYASEGAILTNICVDGSNYVFGDDDEGSDLASFISDVNSYPGHSAALGSCAPKSTAPPPSNIFLCYSASQTQPGVWPYSQAKELFAEGYWLPYAVKGNVAGGTNVGGYHLVCNRAGTQSVNGSSVGDDGTAMGSAYSGVFGIYPELG